MATATELSFTEQVGLTAGDVWRLLNEQGPQTITQVVKKAGAPRDVVMQALGWLARESKIQVEENGNRRMVILVESP